MANKDDNINKQYGKALGDEMQKAINNSDYSRLSDFIANMTERTLVDVHKGFKKGQYRAKKAIKAAAIKAKGNTAAINKPIHAPVAKNPKGTFSAPALLAGSVVSVGASASLALGALLVGGGVLTTAAAVGLFALGIFMGARSGLLTKRLNRFYTYKKALGGRPFCETDELSQAVGKSSRYVAKDLKGMIADDMFPEGRLSDDGDYLLLSEEAQQAYEQMMAGQILMAEERKRLEAEEAARKELEAANPVYKEAREVIAEGEETLALIASVRAGLSPHSEMTKKLARLESVIRRIFDFIEEHPERVMEMRRFMGYYLPTTKKLITQYQKLCDEQIQGENVAKAKGDIEGAIDTISLAFERMLDTFYQETAIDVASDISVMKAMFEQDGLTDDQLKPEAKTASQK